MSLSIPQRFITNLETFTWGEDWRATRIIKERRSNGDYYFASIKRFYGIKDDTHDYDIANTLDESAYLGRIEKFVGERKTDVNPDSSLFGKRIYTDAVTEMITETNKYGHSVEREVLVKGKMIYNYNLPVNDENTKKMKTLAGAIALNQETQFLFLYGASPPHVMEPTMFWDLSVSEYLDKINPLSNIKGNKNNGKSK